MVAIEGDFQAIQEVWRLLKIICGLYEASGGYIVGLVAIERGLEPT